MFTEEEAQKIDQIKQIEDMQRSAMIEINNILRSIEDLSIEGEEKRPDLKAANDNMKDLIKRRNAIFRSIGVTPESNLPDNIEKHLLS
jgi:hypothetical protein